MNVHSVATMLIDEALTYDVIGAFRAVYDELGDGLLENAYIGAMEYECRKRGLHVGREVPTAVYYDDFAVGTYRIDLLIESRLILEIKCCSAIAPEHVRQVLNYLRCTDCELALLLNFGPKPHHKRFVLRNALKRRRREEQQRDPNQAFQRGQGRTRP